MGKYNVNLWCFLYTEIVIDSYYKIIATKKKKNYALQVVINVLSWYKIWFLINLFLKDFINYLYMYKCIKPNYKDKC